MITSGFLEVIRGFKQYYALSLVKRHRLKPDIVRRLTVPKNCKGDKKL
jgi:hypothetical protein